MEQDIQIPREELESLLASLKQGVSILEARLGTEAGSSCHVPGQGDWTKPMLGRLAVGVAPYPAALALLDLAAAHPDVWVNYTQVVDSAGVDRVQVRSELGALTKIAKQLFGTRIWPLRARQARGKETSYMMPAQIAAWWLELRAGGA